MKTTILAATLLFTVISCNAQQVQNRQITAFDKIEVSGAVNVVYTNADTLSLSVQAKDKEIDNVETKVTGTTLMISTNGNFKEPVYVYVKNNKLVSLESSGATDFKTTNAIKGDDFGFIVSGSAEVHAIMDVTHIKASQSGASDLILTGSTDQLGVVAAGASTFKGYGLACKNADVITTGAATAKVYASEKIRASATGASDIKLKGEAKDVSAQSTSAASITRLMDQPAMADSTRSDTTVFNLKHKRILIIKNKKDKDEEKKEDNGIDEDDFKHWVGFSVGVNGYMSPAGGLNVPDKYSYMDLNYGRSFNFQLNVIERQFNIVKNSFKIITGLGLDYHSYELANKTSLNPDSSFTFGKIDSTSTFSYQKNRLRNTYLQVPLLFEFNTSADPSKTFHIAFGVIGQYLITSRTKQVVEDDKYTIKKIRKDSYNMSPFAAKAHVNLGYRAGQFFAEYSLTPLFQSGKGPELYPFSVGLRVIPFA